MNFPPQFDDDDGPFLGSLQDFPRVHEEGIISVCEYISILKGAPSTDPAHPADASYYTQVTDHFMPINAKCLQPFLPRKPPSIRSFYVDESFLQVSEQGFFKSIWDGWRDDGVTGLIRGLRKTGSSPYLISTLVTTLKICRQITNAKANLKALFFPHLRLTKEDLIDSYAPVRNWNKSWTRGMAWHPNAAILAIALHDDTIRIFPLFKGGEKTSVLKSAQQKFITALCWRPLTDNLAVGVEGGMIIWDVDYSIKPRAAKANFITYPGHCPITSLDYSRNGYWLLTASSADTSMIVWDTVSGGRGYTVLRRIAGGGIPRARWSPELSKIFNTTPGNVFRIWKKSNPTIKSTRWTTATRHVEAFCWSPCSKIVIFANDGILYSVNFNPPKIEFLGQPEKPVATPLFDVRECSIPQIGSDLLFKAGGKVVDIAWDSTGKRLAVLFADSEFIALFRIESKSREFIFPIGFIRGHVGEFPLAIDFIKGFDVGAMLTIAWSTQRIQYFPMIFPVEGLGTYAFSQEARRFEHNSRGRQYVFMSQPVAGLHTRTVHAPVVTSSFSSSLGPTTSCRPSTTFKLFSPSP